MAQKLKIDIIAKDRSKRALQGLQGSLGRLKASIFSLQSAFVGLGAGLVIRNLINTGKQIENLQVQLKFLFGSAKEGAKAFDEMAKFASKVPFSLEEIQAGSGVLAVVSDDAKELANLMKITGNVAAVTGLDFKTTSEQIQRSMSAGISAADLFRDKGVKSMLGFKAGATVSIEETVAAFERVFGRGGQFDGATDELAKTFSGTLSMIGDKVFTFKRTLLDAGFFNELKRQLGDLNEFFETNAKEIERLAIQIGTNLASATIKAAKAIKFLSQNIRELQSVLGILLVALGGTIKILTGIALIINDINNRVKGLLNPTENLNKLYEFQDNKVKSILDAQERITKQIEKQEAPIKTIREQFEELNKGSIAKIEEQFKNINTTIAKGVNSGITKMSDGLARALILGEKLSDTFKKMASELLVRVLSKIIEVIARKGVELALEKLITREKEKQFQFENAKAKQSRGGNIGSSLLNFGLSKLFGMASGGAVSKGKPVVVGERGAELFVPNQSGQITQNARGTGGGGSTNVNFNITTLDARGFDQMLVQNRGTITQIINQAVNERGSKNLI